MILRHFILCAQLLFSMRGAVAANCPDGGAGLTRALYEAGNATTYQDVTCIPEEEFKDYEGDVTLNGLPSLKSIGINAFRTFGGKLTFTGEYPALEEIGGSAFNFAGKTDSVIAFNELKSLKSIGSSAFVGFVGKLTITGKCPALETIGGFAFGRLESLFGSVGTADSVVALTGLQSLQSIESYAFNGFGGKLTFTGECHALETIGSNAFFDADNVDSVVALTGLQSLQSIGERAFHSFGGKLTFTGECPALEIIHQGAFQSARNVDSTIAFSRLQSLKSIRGDAFDNFGGKLTFTGEYPHYQGCTRLGHGMNPDPDIVLHAPAQKPLTKAVYEDAAATGVGVGLSSITCIPDWEFKEYAGNVTMNGLQSLKTIGVGALSDFGGTLTFIGEYPALETIGLDAFESAGNADSIVAFNGLQSLQSIGERAFYSFGGKLTVTGEYPALETIGDSAFENADNADSVVTFTGLPSLKSIGERAFYLFGGKLTFTGKYPALETIDEYAFSHQLNLAGGYGGGSYVNSYGDGEQNGGDDSADNTDSVIIFNGLPSLKSIGSNAFALFGGTLTFTGEYPALETIGNWAFQFASNADSVITFNGLPSLKSIGERAFYSFGGKLTFTGEYPTLETIDEHAFSHQLNLSGGYGSYVYSYGDDEQYGDDEHYADNANSTIAFSGLPSLKSLGVQAFYSFGGTLTFTGEYPALETIGSSVFQSAGNANSMVTVNGLPSLKSLGWQPFAHFEGKLTFTGEYPALDIIGQSAFAVAGNAESVVAFTGLQSLKGIGMQAFLRFGGTLNITGEYPALERIDKHAFQNVTNADSTIAFNGLPSLKSLGVQAFYSFGGKLTFTGEYPALETIENVAFQNVTNADSTIAFSGLPSLKSLGVQAFYSFGGTLTFTGEYPALETIEKLAFSSVGNANSMVTVNGLPSLKSIGVQAFYSFGGTLTFTGEYPALEAIDAFAFYGASNADSIIAIACSSPAGLTIAGSAFLSFQGSRDAANELKHCDGATTTTTTVTTTTTTATTVTTTTTTTTTVTTKTTTTTSPCPDGGAGLTQALYEGGNAAAYQDVTCIPDDEFRSYTGDVTLSGLPSLKSIGKDAFEYFGGKLTFTGEYPALETIAYKAFREAGNADSVIAFTGLQSLKSITAQAFESFGGKLTFTGEYPALETVDTYAFKSATNADSVVAFTGLQSLKSIWGNAFHSFGGNLTFTGEYPALETIDGHAFRDAGNAESVIAFTGLQSLKSIGSYAFYSFGGKLTFAGKYPALETIGVGAFQLINIMDNADPFIVLTGLPSLTSIGERAFNKFVGVITIVGEYPALETIDRHAFESAGTSDSVVAIACSSPAGLTISGDAFDSFKGTHNATNELNQCTTTSTTTTTTTTTVVLCPDGSAGLTRALYEAGDSSSYANVTCIPRSEFQGYTGDITLDEGLMDLTSIGESAFSSLSGTLTISGKFPLLSSIGASAFLNAGNANSTIELADGLPKITIIQPAAFSNFKGTLTISGSFPLLFNIRLGAFSYAGNADSTIELVGGLLPRLANVELNAFACMKGNLTIRGNFPLLPNIANMALSDQCTTDNGTVSTTTQVADTYGGATDNTDEPSKGRSDGTVGGVLGAVCGVLALAVGSVVWFRRRQRDHSIKQLVNELCAATNERARLTFLSKYSRQLFSSVQSADEYAALVSALELPRTDLKIVRQLGSGNYGVVTLASLKRKPAPGSDAGAVEVAVKSRLPAEIDAMVDQALLIEALVLHSLKHPHILGLVGVCTTTLPFLVATELMVNGDLKTYLRACRPTQPKPKAALTLLDVSLILEQIAQALAHLEKMAVIHRDVAARNVLVGAAPTQVKLGDLGAARSVFREAEREYTATSDHLPVRWMAPESLMEASFTTKSDVWSFAVFCWEVTTHGKTPYGVFGGVKDILDHVKSGGRLEASVFTPPGLYKQMLLCWSENPKRRPRFADLVHLLGAIRGAVAVAPEATMILDANNEVVQQGQNRARAAADSRSSRSSERRPGAGSVARGGGATQVVLNPTFDGNLLQTPDGYVEDNFVEQGGIAAAANSGRVLVAPDGYVQDNFEQDGQPAVQTSNSAVAANSGRVLVSPDGYVQDNFEQDGQPAVETTNTDQVVLANDTTDVADHTESLFRHRGHSVSIDMGNVDQEEETRL